MANKRPNKNSSGIKGFVIGFAAIIIVIAGVLFWNNYALSSAGTVDGERVPVEFQRFYAFNLRMETEWQLPFFGATWDESWQTQANEVGFEQASQIIVARNWANEIGLELTAEDELEVELRVGQFRSIWIDDGVDFIREMGFSNNQFEQFVRYQILHERLAEYIGLQMPIDGEELAIQLDIAFQEYLLENLTSLRHVFAMFIQVEDFQLANDLMQRYTFGESFEQLIREYSLFFNEEFQEFDEDGEPIYYINILNTPLTEETLSFLYHATEGALIVPQELIDGTWGLYYITHINEPIDFMGWGFETYEELEEIFKAQEENNLRIAHFGELLNVRMQLADIVPNSRIVR